MIAAVTLAGKRILKRLLRKGRKKLKEGGWLGKKLDDLLDYSKKLDEDDLGIDLVPDKNGVKKLDGTLTVSGDKMTVHVDMIQGKVGNPMSIVENLVEKARNEGVSELRISGYLINDRLDKALRARYGLNWAKDGLGEIIIKLECS